MYGFMAGVVARPRKGIMNRSHRVRLYPNNIQKTYFRKACGVARFTYNWALEEWKKQYEAGGKPSSYGLKRRFNSIKRKEFPFVVEVTKTAAERSFTNLNVAFNGFFSRVKAGKKPGYPKFKKRGIRDSFYISNDKFKLNGKSIRVPKLGWVRMAETLRLQGKVLSAVVSCTADKWFVSISVQIPDKERNENQVRSVVGIDLGVSKLATLSDGTVFENIRTTKKYEKKLRRANKSLARKVKGSNNRDKAKMVLSKLHYKIGCVRKDYIHKMTSAIANKYTDVCLEDLNVFGMVKNRRLSKVISDAAFYEIRRQLEYKADKVHLVNRYFPSSKLCMQCGQKHDMPLNQRIFKCDCGYGPIDRDLNASQNILRQGLPDIKPVEMEALVDSGVVNETAVCEAGNTHRITEGILSDFL